MGCVESIRVLVLHFEMVGFPPSGFSSYEKNGSKTMLMGAIILASGYGNLLWFCSEILSSNEPNKSREQHRDL